MITDQHHHHQCHNYNDDGHQVDGSPDIRASATAKATVAAFAASEGHAHPRSPSSNCL